VKGEGTENGFFSGTLNEVPPVGGKLRFYYSATALDDTEKIIDLSSQNGSLPGIASKLVAYADVAVKPDGGDYSATLVVPYSVVKFDLSAFGTTDITMTGTTNSGLTISAKGVKDVMTGGSTVLSGTAVETNT